MNGGKVAYSQKVVMGGEYSIERRTSRNSLLQIFFPQWLQVHAVVYVHEEEKYSN
jgi:hypothetical protein